MVLLGKLEYDQRPYSGEQLTVQSPLYPYVRRVQQAIGKAIETQTQTSENPYSSETEGLMTVLVLPGSETDPNTSAPLGSDLTAIFYHASMFRTLMTKDSLNPQSLLKEFVTCSHPGLMKSPGKSPTFFIFSESGQYLIKQLKPKELALMLKICASYGRHLLDNPSSLLVRIYAMFSITPSKPSASLAPHKASKHDQHFIILPNLFATPQKIVERYDLKGSWVGRHTKLHTPGDRTEKTLKDTNMENYIYLTTLRRRLLIHQLKADSDWLKQHNLIDYSLLLGLTDDIPCIQDREHNTDPTAAPGTPTNNTIGGDGARSEDAETPLPEDRPQHPGRLGHAAPGGPQHRGRGEPADVCVPRVAAPRRVPPGGPQAPLHVRGGHPEQRHLPQRGGRALRVLPRLRPGAHAAGLCPLLPGALHGRHRLPHRVPEHQTRRAQGEGAVRGQERDLRGPERRVRKPVHALLQGHLPGPRLGGQRAPVRRLLRDHHLRGDRAVAHTGLLAAPAAQAAERRGVHGCEHYYVDEPEDHAGPLGGGVAVKAVGVCRDDGCDDDEGDDAAQHEPEELQAAAVLVDEERADDHGEDPAGREGHHRQPAVAPHCVAERLLVSTTAPRQHGGDQVREEVCQRGIPDPDADAERVLEEAVEAPAAPAAAAAAAADDALEDLDDDPVDDADRGHDHYEEEQAAALFAADAAQKVLLLSICKAIFQRRSDIAGVSLCEPDYHRVRDHRDAHADEGDDVLVTAAHFIFPEQ